MIAVVMMAVVKNDGELLGGGCWSTQCYYDLENYRIDVKFLYIWCFVSLKLVSNNDSMFRKWFPSDL